MDADDRGLLRETLLQAVDLSRRLFECMRDEPLSPERLQEAYKAANLAVWKPLLKHAKQVAVKTADYEIIELIQSLEGTQEAIEQVWLSRGGKSSIESRSTPKYTRKKANGSLVAKDAADFQTALSLRFTEMTCHRVVEEIGEWQETNDSSVLKGRLNYIKNLQDEALSSIEDFQNDTSDLWAFDEWVKLLYDAELGSFKLLLEACESKADDISSKLGLAPDFNRKSRIAAALQFDSVRNSRNSGLRSAAARSVAGIYRRVFG